jgi:hypothetical protein
MGASGLGALLSVLLLVPLAQRQRRAGLMVALTIAAAGVFFAIFSFTTAPGPAIVAFFLTGIPVPIVMTTNNGLIQVLAPSHMRGRLLTLYLMFSFGLQPLSNLWVGWMAQHLGAPTAIRVNGFSMLTIGLLMLLRPGLATWVPATSAAAGEKVRPTKPARD